MTPFETTLTAHIPRLQKWTFTLTRDHDQAADLLQQTLCTALAKRELFRDDRNIRGWLLKIAYNLFVTECRRAAHFKKLLDGRQGSPSFTEGNQEIRLALRDACRALDRLPAGQQLLVLLFAFEDITYDDAAAVLAIPSGTIKSRLSRGRDVLRIAALPE